eukprot:g5358.t1
MNPSSSTTSPVIPAQYKRKDMEDVIITMKEIVESLRIREVARKDKDYLAADIIRDNLRMHGIEIFDRDREWRCVDGRRGIIGTYCVLSPPNDVIIKKVKKREEARTVKDYATSDRLREELRRVGVELFDKARLWKTTDGRSGPLLFDAQEDGIAYIERMIEMRDYARKNRDFQKSDQIRETLRKIGVEVFDRDNFWRSKFGHCGLIGGNKPTDNALEAMLQSRDLARQRRDFKFADRVRSILSTHGFFINDQKKMWSSRDGRQGTLRPFSNVTYDRKKDKKKEAHSPYHHQLRAPPGYTGVGNDDSHFMLSQEVEKTIMKIYFMCT